MTDSYRPEIDLFKRRVESPYELDQRGDLEGCRLRWPGLLPVDLFFVNGYFFRAKSLAHGFGG